MMIKKPLNTNESNFFAKNWTIFVLSKTCDFTSIKINLNTVLKIIKSLTLDLPIAYANIRV